MIKRRAGWRCEKCGARHQREAPLHAHHLVPVDQGGEKYSPANLLALCGTCHVAVHRELRRGYPQLTLPQMEERAAAEDARVAAHRASREAERQRMLADAAMRRAAGKVGEGLSWVFGLILCAFILVVAGGVVFIAGRFLAETLGLVS